MKKRFCAAVAALLLAAPALVRADPSLDDLDALVVVDWSHDSAEVSDQQYGDGKQEVKTPSFQIKLRNHGMDAIPPVSVKLYVMGAERFKKEILHKPEALVAKVLQKKQIELPVMGDELTVELGQAEFKSQVTQKGNETWYGGYVYDGYACEIYAGDKLLGVKFGGDSEVRTAYQAMLKGG